MFGKRVSSIEENAFYNCSSLTEVIIPDTVSKVGGYAFRGCTSLTKVFIPQNTSIGENTFYGCNSLTIYTPKKAKCISSAKTYGYKYEICASPAEMPSEEQ